MSSRKSILMMTNTGDGPDSYTVYGDKIRADSYYGHTDGLMTVQVVYSNFSGGFGIQGTLSLDPQEDDWFWIQLNYLNGQYIDTPYFVYPQDPLNPTGSSGNSIQNVGDTGTSAFSFVGNMTYLRAVCYRDYINPPPSLSNDGRWYLGQIDKVLLSL
jgi:hypothetical protein